MKIYYYFLLLLPALLGASCNKDEGLGGSSSLEGYVYNVVHQDDNFSFQTDTFPAVREDVYLIFGDNDTDFYGDDVKTDPNGLYRFDYLRKGNYVVYACSNFADGHKVGETQKVKVSGGLNKAEPIYIHTGKAYGTAMIKGSIHATYYHNGLWRDEGPGIGVRVYIRHAGEEAPFDDIKAGENGVFIFQKLLPGDYIISVETEDKDTEKVDVINSGIIQIRETGKMYEIPEKFEVIVSV
ncbi:MAG: hypothetical protein LBO74_11955 [Candidatus Symbiothrix sp.]|jgi:hypothetical protein|nr:hypothetical protein [Candidatus Symbiothrix sp.]